MNEEPTTVKLEGEKATNFIKELIHKSEPDPRDYALSAFIKSLIYLIFGYFGYQAMESIGFKTFFLAWAAISIVLFVPWFLDKHKHRKVMESFKNEK